MNLSELLNFHSHWNHHLYPETHFQSSHISFTMYPSCIYLFKVNNRESKLALKISERRHWRFLLLTLNKLWSLVSFHFSDRSLMSSSKVKKKIVYKNCNRLTKNLICIISLRSIMNIQLLTFKLFVDERSKFGKPKDWFDLVDLLL